eukprot:scaffold1136_cov260-Pinguiococcus_pyrenoidosus.AAC.25
MGNYMSCFDLDGRPEELRRYRYDAQADVLGQGQFGTVCSCASRLHKWCPFVPHLQLVSGLQGSPLQWPRGGAQGEVPRPPLKSLLAFLAEVLMDSRNRRWQVMSKETVTEYKMHEALREEVEILLMIDHPHVIKAYEFFEDEFDYYLSTELLTGGELFDRIVETRKYSERNARDLAHVLLRLKHEANSGAPPGHLVSTIGYLHDMDVVHRDIKPENLLLVNSDDDTQVKIADFGFAKRLQGKKSDTACGTPGYIGPEILRGEAYGVEVDIFSVGVVLYILLSGRPPFYDSNDRKRIKKNREVEYSFKKKYWRHVSRGAKDLIAKMLAKAPSERITARKALEHPWMMEPSAELDKRQIPGAMTELRRFNLKRKFRAIVRAAVISGQLQTVADTLSKQFETDPTIRERHEQKIKEYRSRVSVSQLSCAVSALAPQAQPKRVGIFAGRAWPALHRCGDAVGFSTWPLVDEEEKDEAEDETEEAETPEMPTAPDTSDASAAEERSSADEKRLSYSDSKAAGDS